MASERVLLDAIQQILDLLCVRFLAVYRWRNEAQGCNGVKQIAVENSASEEQEDHEKLSAYLKRSGRSAQTSCAHRNLLTAGAVSNGE
jgi:hypothetical protein